MFDIRTIIRDKMIKKISPQAIVALEKALSVIYWYKDDLKRYLYQAIDHAEILSVINWSEPKRNIVARVISMLEKMEKRHMIHYYN